jgi:hypothetical protein
MRKFDDQEQQGANPGSNEPVIRLAVPRPPALARSASDEGLKALVGFAIGRGYYERWNNPVELRVTPCKSKVFPTDKGGDSR